MTKTFLRGLQTSSSHGTKILRSITP